MYLKASIAAMLLCVSTTLCAPAAYAAPSKSSEEPLCAEETVYGTVVVLDESLGVFGLLGTRYKFQSMQSFDLQGLQGRMVKIDIGMDCGIEDLHVLDGDSESIT